MSVVDVSRIPNNNKFDPVREAILQLEGIIESETAGVFSINGEQGALTLQAGTNITITNPSDGVIQIASSAGAGGIEGELTLAAGDGITLSSPTVFDGTENVTITITNDDRPNAGVLTLVAGSGMSIPEAKVTEEETQTWGAQDRVWSVSEGNTFSANELNDKSITLIHADTSSAASSANTNGVVIQSIGIDEFGHTQSIATTDLDNRYLQLSNANVADWDEAYSWGDHALAGYLTSYTETDPTVGAHIKAISIVDISNWDTAYSWGDHSTEGYLTSFTETDPTVGSHIKAITTTDISNWDEAYSWGNHADAGYLTSIESETDPTVPSHVKSITTTNIDNWNLAYADRIRSAFFSTATGIVTLVQDAALYSETGDVWGGNDTLWGTQEGDVLEVDIDGRYVQLDDERIPDWEEAYDNQIVSASFNTGDGVLTLTQQDAGTVTVDLDGRYSATDTNNYVSSVTFSTSTGVLTLNREGLSALTVDLDGKYLNIGDKAADANLLDGLDSTYFLNYNNLTNKPTIPTVNNNTITIAAGGAMTGGGDFTVNQSFNETITISHADTSTQASVNNSGRTYIQDITLDTYGHVIGIASATDSDTTYTAGGGLTLSGTTFSHLDTSSQGSVNNSGTTFVQDITLDTYGHITGINSASVTVPTVYDSIITINAGTSMTGGGSFGINQSFNETITISHADTSALSGTYGSTDDSVKIDTITVDGNGHITAITTGSVAGTGGSTPNNSVIQIAAGAGLGGGGVFTLNQSFGETITLTHADTSSQASVSNSSNTFIQSITLDTYGHIVGMTSGTATTGGGGDVGTLQQVTDLGNTTTNSVSIGKSTAPEFALDVNGTIRATFDVLAFSDERVKENIQTIPDALEKILCLRGVTFNKIGNKERSVGVIAQEVEKVLPEVVRSDSDGMKSVAYGNMVGLLIQAMKEQQLQIEQLRTEIKYLKSN